MSQISLNPTPGAPVMLFTAPSGALAIIQLFRRNNNIAVDISWVRKETEEDHKAIEQFIGMVINGDPNSIGSNHSFSCTAEEANAKIHHFLTTGKMVD